MELVLLGTGAPNLSPDRFQSSLAVVADGQPYLVDCGGGTVQRVSQAIAAGFDALRFVNLTHLFLTHLHPDHTTGLADLMIAPWVDGRTAALEVFGPIGTRDLVAATLSAHSVGIDEHRHGPAPIDHELAVNVHDVRAGRVFVDEHVAVDAVRVDHGSLAAYGFRFASSERTIVVSGDTRPTDNFAEFAAGCDVLVHEVYSAQNLNVRPEAWRRYHRAFHTSTRELGSLALQVRPKLLVLTHQLFWGATEAELLAEVREIYDGPVVSGRDLAVF